MKIHNFIFARILCLALSFFLVSGTVPATAGTLLTVDPLQPAPQTGTDTPVSGDENAVPDNYSSFLEGGALSAMNETGPDFTDDFERTGLGDDWTVRQGRWDVVNGELMHLYQYPYTSRSQKVITLNRDLESNDYEISAGMIFRYQYGDPSGFVARYTDENNYYYVYMSPYQGEVYMAKVANGQRTWLGTTHLFDHLDIEYPWRMDLNTPHPARFVVEDDHLQFFYGDTLILEAYDSELKDGDVGLFASRYNNSFEDFELTLLNKGLPLERPEIDPIDEYIPDAVTTFSGTKAAGTGIWLNGVQVVAPDSSTAWSFEYAFDAPGFQELRFQARDAAGNASPERLRSTTYEPLSARVFYDFFAGDSLGEDWTVRHGNWSAADGQLSHDYSSPDPRGWLTADWEFGSDDLEVEADFRISGSVNRTSKGLIARYTDEQNYYYAYVEKLYSYSYVRIYKVQNGVFQQLANKRTYYYMSRDFDFNLRFIAEGGSLQLFVDDKLELSVTDTAPLEGGTAGIYSYYYGDRADNFRAVALGDIALPPGRPTVNTIPAYMNTGSITLSGTKDAGTSIRINGEEAVAANGNTTWSALVNLQGEGLLSVFDITAVNAAGESGAVSLSTTLDATLPGGTLLIGDGNPVTFSRDVTLHVTAADGLSGVDQVRYSADGAAWTSWEDFQASRELTLAGSTGPRTIHYQIRDFAGNIVTVTEDIELRAGEVVQYAIATSMKYFEEEFGTIDANSGYPVEGFHQKNFTQPTNIGFYTQLLANVATGDIANDVISSADALARLNKVLDSLLADQANSQIAYKGLLPWLNFENGVRVRAAGAYGQQVMTGDNANLSLSLATASGALQGPGLAGNATAQMIRQKIETFLDNQQEGYEYLYYASQERMRRGWNFAGNYWVGGDTARHTYFGDEFRGGLLFLSLRYGLNENIYTKLSIALKEYEMQDGSHILSAVSPYDGSAFQMLWPTLTMPETQSPSLTRMLEDFVDIALDFSDKNNLDGFLSASYSGEVDGSGNPVYRGNIGIQDLAQHPGIIENVASLYILGAAHMVRPAAIEAVLQGIFERQPGLISEHGLWEGMGSDGNVITEQIVANVASFVLGLSGAGPEQMRRYLDSRSLGDDLDRIWEPGDQVNVLQDDPHPTFFATYGKAYRLLDRDIRGRQLTIRYRTNGADIGPVKVEFKHTGSYSPAFAIPDMHFENTGTGEGEITMNIPLLSGTFDSMGEIVLLFSGGSASRSALEIFEFTIL